MTNKCPLRDVVMVLQLIEESGVEAVIAGGCAAAPKLASDIDIFVFGGIDAGVAMLRTCSIKGLQLTRQYYEDKDIVIPPWWASEKEVANMVTAESFADLSDVYGDGMPGKKVLVAHTSMGYWVRNIQIIIAEEKNVDALLSGFDISTHMWALVGSIRNRVGCALSTDIDEPLIIRRFHSPWTLKRAKKLAERYEIGIANYEEAEAAITAASEVSQLCDVDNNEEKG